MWIWYLTENSNAAEISVMPEINALLNTKKNKKHTVLFLFGHHHTTPYQVHSIHAPTLSDPCTKNMPSKKHVGNNMQAMQQPNTMWTVTIKW